MNEDQYYSPIIQAMVHTATLQKQGQQQEIEKERNKNEAAARKEALGQAQQTIDQNHENQLRQHDLALQQLEVQHQHENLQAELARFEATKKLQEVLGGAKPGFDINQIAPGISKFLQGGQQQGQFSQQQAIPALPPEMSYAGPPQSDQQIPAAAPVGNPMTGLFDENAKARQAGAEAGAVANARLPAETELRKTEFGFNKQLQDARVEAEKDLADKHIISAEKIAGLSRAAQMSIANMENKTRLIVAGMGGDEGSQSLVNSLKMGLATGEIKLNPTNRLHQVAYEQLQNDNWKAVDPVDIKEAKGMQNIEPLLGKLRKLADELPDNPVSEALTRGSEAVKNTFITSKLRNDISVINSQIMNVARSTEGVTGRVLASALKPELDSLASVTSKSNMKDRIDNLEGNYVNKMNNVIFAGMPEDQREVINKKHGLKPVGAKPDFLKLAPQKNKTGHTLDEDASIKMGQPVYK